MTKPRRLDYERFEALQSSLRKAVSQAKLPASTRQNITDLLLRMFYLMWQANQKSPKASWYCVPGRPYLAASIHVTPRSITTFTNLLRDLGWINKVQRRPSRRGLRRTNLYRPGPRLRAALSPKAPSHSKANPASLSDDQETPAAAPNDT